MPRPSDYSDDEAGRIPGFTISTHAGATLLARYDEHSRGRLDARRLALLAWLGSTGTSKAI